MRLLDLLRDQDGLVRHDQALGLGMSYSAIDRRVSSGEWDVVHPRVYRAADHPPSPRGKLRAAALWAGENATLIGHAAASWWGLTDREPDDLTVAVGATGNHTTPPGIVAVRRNVAAVDRIVEDGVWVTRRSFAALEAAVALGLIEGSRLLDRAL